MPNPAAWIPWLFAGLGLLYLTLGLRVPASTAVGPNPARKARIRVGLVFFAVSLFLLLWNRTFR